MKAQISLPEAVAWLYSTQLFGIKLGLAGMHRLARAMGVELEGPRASKFIHVAGTNGKGSTCAMVASICQAQGWRTGLYTSPHLLSLKERFQISGERIPETVLCEELNRIREQVEGWEPHPTFFEIVTVLALRWFQQESVDIVVLETGMGGRLDATNIVTPLVSVLTPIGLDHQQHLGESLALIAEEKAGIFKPGIPVISALQEEEALAVFRDKARLLGCSLEVVEQPWTESAVALKGKVQRWNAALAIAALRAARLPITSASIEKGLSNVRWPGRFEKVGDNLILDGAHNPHAARVLCETWQTTFPGERAELIFGALQDKDVCGLLNALIPITGKLTLVQITNPRALTVEQLHEIALEQFPAVPRSTAASLEEALARPAQLRRLVCGSLYLVGEAIGLLQGHTPERSTQ